MPRPAISLRPRKRQKTVVLDRQIDVCVTHMSYVGVVDLLGYLHNNIYGHKNLSAIVQHMIIERGTSVVRGYFGTHRGRCIITNNYYYVLCVLYISSYI